MTGRAPQEPEERIDYDEVLAAYTASLTTVLRGFRATATHDFLATWVPDRDPVSSLINMLEAAEGAGLESLTIRVGAAAPDLDVPRLEQTASTLGAVTLHRPEGPTGPLELSVRFGSGPPGSDVPRPTRAQPRLPAGGGPAAVSRPAGPSVPTDLSELRSIHPAFRAGLTTFSDGTAHAGTIPPADGQQLIATRLPPITVTATVSGDPDRVIELRHDGAPTAMLKALLDAFCTLAKDLPLQELADHGSLRLMEMLSDPTHPAPVPGVRCPENCDPAFLVVRELGRGLLRARSANRPPSPTDNRYDPLPAVAWRALERPERIERVQQAITAADPALVSPADGVQCVDVDDHQRVTLTFAPTVPPGRQTDLLHDLERVIRARIDRALRTYGLEMTDQSQIRRLSGRPGENHGQ